MPSAQKVLGIDPTADGSRYRASRRSDIAARHVATLTSSARWIGFAGGQVGGRIPPADAKRLGGWTLATK